MRARDVVSTQLFEYRDFMAPAAALEKQIARYRGTGEQRLLLARDLHAFSCEIARENIRRAYPAPVEQLLHIVVGVGARGMNERDLLVDCLRRLNRTGSEIKPKGT